MDYNSIHGPGVSNFSSSSPHRMPTVSAAQALQELKSSPTRSVSTGLSLLDCALQSREPLSPDAEPVYGGVSRGKVTEIYGPPGAGKTALCMQLAASALHAGDGVIWVDASHPISGYRFSQILSSFKPLIPRQSDDDQDHDELLANLAHLSVPTLAHLIGLISHPSQNNPPSNTSLLIIDSFSTLMSTAFPRSADSNATPKKPGAPNPSSRKFPILQHIATSLQKLALTRNIAIVVVSQCVTKMRPGLGAVLVPSINTTAWEQGMGCRVAIFRDWGWDDDEGNKVDDVRLAMVIKAEGTVKTDGKAKVVGFGIGETGLKPLTLPTTAPAEPNFSSPFKGSPLKNVLNSTPRLPTLPQKRKFSATELEIPDSDAEDDEDYGWAEEDAEEMPPLPPQWQGSEDAIGPGIGEGEEVEEERDPELDFGSPEKEVAKGAESEVERVIEDSEDELAL